MITPQCITVNAFCAAYGIGRTKAFEYLKQNRLERVRFGRRTCITVRSAQALMEEAAAEAAQKRGA